MATEPLTTENEDRFVIFPLEYIDLFSLYKTAEASIWSLEDLEFGMDSELFFKNLSSSPLKFLKFFSSILNLLHSLEKFSNPLTAIINTEIQSTEARFFLSFKIMANNVSIEALNFILKKLFSEFHLNKEKGIFDFDLNEFISNIKNSKINLERNSILKDLISKKDNFAEIFEGFMLTEGLMFFSDLYFVLKTISDLDKENGIRKLFNHILFDKYLQGNFNFLIYKDYIEGKIKNKEILEKIKKIETEGNEFKTIFEMKGEKIADLFGIKDSNIKVNEKDKEIIKIDEGFMGSVKEMMEEFEYKGLEEDNVLTTVKSQDFNLDDEF